jgi:hypothetical protein
MRGLAWHLLTLIFGGACAALSACAMPGSASNGNEFQLSFSAGSRDGVGHFMGGTEVRVLAGHGGKLCAGNGCWEGRPGPEGPQGAQILVLDGSGAHWRVDHALDERMPSGRLRDLAISALREVSFATDGTGVRLPSPVSVLIASTWDLTGTTRIFSRDDATGAWTVVSTRWRTRPSYVVAAYNMARIHDDQRGDLLLIGLEAFIPQRAPAPSGHSVVGVGYGRLEAGGWYLVRYPDGRYDLGQITASPMTGQALVATRSIASSPFPNDGGTLYFAGYDANKAPAHNTAWIFRASVAMALGAAPVRASWLSLD